MPGGSVLWQGPTLRIDFFSWQGLPFSTPGQEGAYDSLISSSLRLTDEDDMFTDRPIAADEWETTLTAFQLAYAFLSKVFYNEPQADFIDTLVDGDLFSDWPLGGGEQATAFGLTLLQGFRDAWSHDALPDLRWDYTRLFVGPGPILAPPWESVYRSRERLLFEPTTLDVRRAYARFGLQAPRLNQEPDDHLGLELAFMLHLCGLGVQAAQAQDNVALDTALAAQRDFLSQHLLQWAPECLTRVTEHAHSDYYRGVAHLALGTLARAAVLLGAEPRPEVKT